MRGADGGLSRHSLSSVPVHPHMRGADDADIALTVVCDRFIPTCVGQIAHGRRRPLCFRRFIPTCVGQIITRPCVSVSTAGSSPHAWGRCKSAFSTSTSTTVHPHMRGADVSAFCTISMIQRFIPTCVGQMCPAARQSPTAAVHPHMRGADGHALGQDVSGLRFIPTCVGQMRWRRARSRPPWRFIPTCVGQI